MQEADFYSMRVDGDGQGRLRLRYVCGSASDKEAATRMYLRASRDLFEFLKSCGINQFTVSRIDDALRLTYDGDYAYIGGTFYAKTEDLERVDWKLKETVSCDSGALAAYVRRTGSSCVPIPDKKVTYPEVRRVPPPSHYRYHKKSKRYSGIQALLPLYEIPTEPLLTETLDD